MFELPEFVILAGQMNDTLHGKTVKQGLLGNSPHKFVWYNQSHEAFERLTHHKTVGRAWAKGKWLFLPLDPDYLLVLGECGGKVLYHPAGEAPPAKYHLLIGFDDGSFLSATTQMWGAMELYVRGEEQNRQYIVNMRPTPTEPTFTFNYFDGLLDSLAREKKGTAKALLTQNQLIPGLGNGLAQDILYTAHLHPKHAIAELSEAQRCAFYEAIMSIVQTVIQQGGREDEFNLYGQRGGYPCLMSKNTVGRPCPNCGHEITKIQYLGGACYFCGNCQS